MTNHLIGKKKKTRLAEERCRQKINTWPLIDKNNIKRSAGAQTNENPLAPINLCPNPSVKRSLFLRRSLGGEAAMREPEHANASPFDKFGSDDSRGRTKLRMPLSQKCCEIRCKSFISFAHLSLFVRFIYVPAKPRKKEKPSANFYAHSIRFNTLEIVKH